MVRTPVEVEVPPAVARFLEGVEAGDWDGMDAFVSEDVLYDATVPGWRYVYEGAERVLREYRQAWTGKHAWRFVELHVSPIPAGAVVDFELRGRCPGDESHAPHEEGCRIANIFRIEDGRIAEHRFYCCGEWDEETLERIAKEAPRVERRER